MMTILKHPKTGKVRVIHHRFSILAWLFPFLYFLYYGAWRWVAISLLILFPLYAFLVFLVYAGAPFWIKNAVGLLVQLYFGYKAPEALIETYTRRGWIAKTIIEEEEV